LRLKTLDNLKLTKCALKALKSPASKRSWLATIEAMIWAPLPRRVRVLTPRNQKRLPTTCLPCGTPPKSTKPSRRHTSKQPGSQVNVT